MVASRPGFPGGLGGIGQIGGVNSSGVNGSPTAGSIPFGLPSFNPPPLNTTSTFDPSSLLTGGAMGASPWTGGSSSFSNVPNIGSGNSWNFGQIFQSLIQMVQQLLSLMSQLFSGMSGGNPGGGTLPQFPTQPTGPTQPPWQPSPTQPTSPVGNPPPTGYASSYSLFNGDSGSGGTLGTVYVNSNTSDAGGVIADANGNVFARIVPSGTGGDDTIVDRNGNVIGSAHFISGQAGGSEAMHIRSDGRVTGTYEWPPILNRFGGPSPQFTGAYELVFNNSNNPIGQEMMSQGSGPQPITPTQPIQSPSQPQPTPSNPFNPDLQVGQKRPWFSVNSSSGQTVLDGYSTLQPNGDILMTDTNNVPRAYIQGYGTITDLSGNIIGRWYLADPNQPDGAKIIAPAYNPAAPHQWAAVFNGTPWASTHW